MRWRGGNWLTGCGGCGGRWRLEIERLEIGILRYWVIGILGLVWGLAGCAAPAASQVPATAVPSAATKPTRTATAVSPPPTAPPPQQPISEPAAKTQPTRTMTAAPPPSAAFTAVPPSPTSRPSPTAVPGTPTPSPIPRAKPGFPIDTNARYLDYPPEQTECDGTGSLFRSRFPSKFGGLWRDYHVYLPPCYGQGGRVYPVLYLLHGSIQTDSHWADLGLKWYMDAGIRDGRYPPFIAIMPYNGEIGNVTSGGEGSTEEITVNWLIPYVDQVYCTWAEKEGRSIGGISRGGYWALEIAFRHDELFTAVSGHSSQLRLDVDPPPYNPLVSYADADLSDMRIWLDWGEYDF
ncbi:MAG TPA: hypothetical protein ENK32_05035, partial [Anaerolineae bacterium]|nr:hypothetical protein [Anaerolineae bacterium]